MTNETASLSVRTTWGSITVNVYKGEINRCDMPFVADDAPGAFRFLSSKITAESARDRTALRAANAFIRGVLNGKKVQSPRVLIPQGTELQKAVWTYLSRMKPREYVTYGQLAKAIGRARAARAVGQACGANPIPLFIPCHRVLGASGSAGGFSCGMAWKHLLIKMDTGKSISEVKQSLRISAGKAGVVRRAA